MQCEHVHHWTHTFCGSNNAFIPPYMGYARSFILGHKNVCPPSTNCVRDLRLNWICCRSKHYQHFWSKFSRAKTRIKVSSSFWPPKNPMSSIVFIFGYIHTFYSISGHWQVKYKIIECQHELHVNTDFTYIQTSFIKSPGMQWFHHGKYESVTKRGKQVGRIRYEARSLGRSSPNSLAFWAYETPRQ